MSFVTGKWIMCYIKNDMNKNIFYIVIIYVGDILIVGKENEIKYKKGFFKEKY